jgi:uncharacterized protein
MIKKISVFLFVFLGLCSIASAQENNIKKFAGKWVGTYQGEGQEQTATIVFKVENGKLSGMAESTENPSGEPMVIENIVVNGSNIKFEIMSVIKYDGILKEDIKTIEGTLIGMNGEGVKLNLALKDIPVPAVSYKDFIGSWTAKLSAEEGEKIFILVLTEKEGKLSGTIENTTQNLSPIELSNLNTEGNKISFEIPAANVSYSGVYNVSKKTIEGMGTENQNGFNINFVKDEKAPVK